MKTLIIIYKKNGLSTITEGDWKQWHTYTALEQIGVLTGVHRATARTAILTAYVIIKNM